MPHFTRSSSLCSKSQKWNSKISVFLELGRTSDCRQRWKNVWIQVEQPGNQPLKVQPPDVAGLDVGVRCSFMVSVHQHTTFDLNVSGCYFRIYGYFFGAGILPGSPRAPPPHTRPVPSPTSPWCSAEETHTSWALTLDGTVGHQSADS